MSGYSKNDRFWRRGSGGGHRSSRNDPPNSGRNQNFWNDQNEYSNNYNNFGGNQFGGYNQYGYAQQNNWQPPQQFKQGWSLSNPQWTGSSHRKDHHSPDQRHPRASYGSTSEQSTSHSYQKDFGNKYQEPRNIWKELERPLGSGLEIDPLPGSEEECKKMLTEKLKKCLPGSEEERKKTLAQATDKLKKCLLSFKSEKDSVKESYKKDRKSSDMGHKKPKESDRREIIRESKTKSSSSSTLSKYSVPKTINTSSNAPLIRKTESLPQNKESSQSKYTSSRKIITQETKNINKDSSAQKKCDAVSSHSSAEKGKFEGKSQFPAKMEFRDDLANKRVSALKRHKGLNDSEKQEKQPSGTNSDFMSRKTLISKESLGQLSLNKDTSSKDGIQTAGDFKSGSNKNQDQKNYIMNLKNRIIRQLLGMSKNNLKDLVNNPRNRKFEFVMKHLVKERQIFMSQEQRGLAHSRICSQSTDNQESENFSLDTNVAVDLVNLPPEIIEHLGNLLHLDLSQCLEPSNVTGPQNVDEGYGGSIQDLENLEALAASLQADLNRMEQETSVVTKQEVLNNWEADENEFKFSFTKEFEQMSEVAPAMDSSEVDTQSVIDEWNTMSQSRIPETGCSSIDESRANSETLFSPVLGNNSSENESQGTYIKKQTESNLNQLGSYMDVDRPVLKNKSALEEPFNDNVVIEKPQKTIHIKKEPNLSEEDHSEPRIHEDFPRNMEHLFTHNSLDEGASTREILIKDLPYGAMPVISKDISREIKSVEENFGSTGGNGMLTNTRETCELQTIAEKDNEIKKNNSEASHIYKNDTITTEAVEDSSREILENISIDEIIEKEFMSHQNETGLEEGDMVDMEIGNEPLLGRIDDEGRRRSGDSFINSLNEPVPSKIGVERDTISSKVDSESSTNIKTREEFTYQNEDVCEATVQKLTFENDNVMNTRQSDGPFVPTKENKDESAIRRETRETESVSTRTIHHNDCEVKLTFNIEKTREVANLNKLNSYPTEISSQTEYGQILVAAGSGVAHTLVPRETEETLNIEDEPKLTLTENNILPISDHEKTKGTLQDEDEVILDLPASKTVNEKLENEQNLNTARENSEISLKENQIPNKLEEEITLDKTDTLKVEDNTHQSNMTAHDVLQENVPLEPNESILPSLKVIVIDTDQTNDMDRIVPEIKEHHLEKVDEGNSTQQIERTEDNQAEPLIEMIEKEDNKTQHIESAEEHNEAEPQMEMTEEEVNKAQPMEMTGEEVNKVQPMEMTEEEVNQAQPMEMTGEEVNKAQPMEMTEEEVNKSQPMEMTGEEGFIEKNCSPQKNTFESGVEGNKDYTTLENKDASSKSLPYKDYSGHETNSQCVRSPSVFENLFCELPRLDRESTEVETQANDTYSINVPAATPTLVSVENFSPSKDKASASNVVEEKPTYYDTETIAENIFEETVANLSLSDTQKTNDQSQSANEVGTQTHSRDELHPHDVQRMLQLLEKSSQLSPQLAKLLKDHFSSSESTTLVREESMEEAQACADIWPDVCYDNQKEPHLSNRREQNNLTSHRKSSRSASALKRRPRLAPLRSVTPQVGSEPSFVVAAGTSGFRSADRSGRNVVSEDTNPISQGLYSELSPHYYTSVIAEMLDIDKEFERLSKRKLELYKKFNFIPGLAERLNNNSSPSPRATSPMESERLLANNNAGLNQEALDVVANIGGSNNIMPLLSTRLMSKLDVVSPSMVILPNIYGKNRPLSDSEKQNLSGAIQECMLETALPRSNELNKRLRTIDTSLVEAVLNSFGVPDIQNKSELVDTRMETMQVVTQSQPKDYGSNLGTKPLTESKYTQTTAEKLEEKSFIGSFSETSEDHSSCSKSQSKLLSQVLQNPSSEDPGLNSRVRTNKKSPKVVVKPLELTKDEDKGEDDEDINLSNLRKGQIKEKDTEAKRSVRQSGSNESNEKTHIRDSGGRRRNFLNETHSEIKSSEPRSKRRHIDEENESDLTPRNSCRKVRNLNDDIKAIEKPTNSRNENIQDMGKSSKVKNKRGKCVDGKELMRENEIRTFTNDQELAPTFDVENSKGKLLNKEQMEAKQEDVRRSRTLSRGKNKEVGDTSEISNKMEKGANDEKEISKSVERSSRKDSKTLKNYQSNTLETGAKLSNSSSRKDSKTLKNYQSNTLETGAKLSNEKDKNLNKNSEIDSKLSESKSRRGRHSYRDSKNLKMSKSTSSRARSNEKKQVEHKENEIQELSNTKNDPKGRKEINLKDEIQKEVKDSFAINSRSVKRDDSQPRTFRKIKPSEEFPVSEGATMLRTRRATKETREVKQQIMPRRKSSVKSYNENILSGDWEEITGRIKARRDRSLDASSETEEFSRPVSVTRKQFSRPRRQTKQSQESTELIETATEHTQQSLESTPKRKARQISKEEETPLESPVESRTTRRRSLSKSESSSDILLTPELTRKKNTKKGPSSQIDLEHSSTLSDISDEGLVTPVIKKVGDSKLFRGSPVDFVSGRTSNLGDLTSGKRSHLGDHSSGRRSCLGDPSSGRRSRLGDSSSGRRSCLGDPISGGRSHSGDAAKDILDTSLDSISSEQEKDSGRGKKRKADELESLPTNVSKIAASSNLKKCFIFIEPLSMEKLEMNLGFLANTSTSIPEEHSIVEVETEEMAISEPPVIDHYEPNEEIPKLNSGEKSPTMEELQQEFHSGVIVENIDLPCATQEFLKIPECANIDENSFSVSDSVSLMSDGELRRQREDCDRDSSYSFDTPTHSVGTPCHSFGTPTHSLGTPTHDWGERASSRQGKHKSSKKHKRDKKSDSPDHLIFETHSGPILDIKTVGRHILAASEDSNVYCYSLKSGKFKRKYEGHTAAVTCLSVMEVSPHTGGETPSELDGGEQEAQIYSASLDTYLRSFMFRSGELVHEPQSTGSPVQCMDQNWGYVYLGTKTGEVARFNIKRSCMVGDHLRMSQESILAIKATKEGPRKVLIIGTRSQPISIRDATNGLLLRSMNGNWTHTVYSLLLESSLVYCGTSTGDIPVFEFTKYFQKTKIEILFANNSRKEGLVSYRCEPGRKEGSASYRSELGRKEGLASYRGELGGKEGYNGQLRQEKTGHEVCRLKAGFGVVCMRLYNNMLFAGCYDGGIYVFSVQDKTLMTCITGPGKMLLCMDILKNMVIAGSKEGNLLRAWGFPPELKTIVKKAKHGKIGQ
uniref:Uncharacterized protein n=1 Tax=Timema poppense TaxID=170557 RepID=A0A7R9CLK8_TIMPO|nr:unnamed protein product [Timema poppensis]